MKREGRVGGQVGIVTGGARGIGKSIARILGLEGARVGICDIDEETGRATEAELRGEGIGADFLRLDLSQTGEPQRMVQGIFHRYGRLDILVNNARSGQRKAMLEEDEESWDKAMAVTLKAAFFASQEAIRAMAKTGGGTIVNVGSVAAFLVCRESPSYHIAKAGLVQMTRYLAVEAGAFRVRVNAVLPGFIVQDEHRQRYESGDNQEYRTIAEFCQPMSRVGRSDDVARAVLYLCSEEASFISGHCLVVDGGARLQEQFGLVYRYSREKFY